MRPPGSNNASPAPSRPCPTVTAADPSNRHARTPTPALTCPDCLSDGQFLRQHRDQLTRTQALIAAGESSGNTRLVEMNLTRMIATVEQLHASLANDDEGDPRRER
jgi:hypothetical protein